MTFNVSFWWPHEVPARAFRMLRRLLLFVAIVLVWGVKVNEGSKVTPRIFGVFSRSSVELRHVTWGWELSCLDQGVKRVTDDFEGAIVR